MRPSVLCDTVRLTSLRVLLGLHPCNLGAPLAGVLAALAAWPNGYAKLAGLFRIAGEGETFVWIRVIYHKSEKSNEIYHC